MINDENMIGIGRYELNLTLQVFEKQETFKWLLTQKEINLSIKQMKKPSCKEI